jgi:hypothetical protein
VCLESTISKYKQNKRSIPVAASFLGLNSGLLCGRGAKIFRPRNIAGSFQAPVRLSFRRRPESAGCGALFGPPVVMLLLKVIL